MNIEELLKTEYYILDILPQQVPAGAPGQYNAVEKFFLRDPDLPVKKRDILLRLNCYYDLEISDPHESWTVMNPAPEMLEEKLRTEQLLIRVGDSLITADHNDTYMTIFHPDEKLL